jgi:mono/diheme cytochrome c family protein
MIDWLKENRWTNFALLALAIFTVTSCYYDKADLVYPPPAACDTSTVTYSSQVVPILSTNCYTCHSGSAASGGGIKLDTYTTLKVQVSNGKLLGAIEHRSGYSAMPQGGAQLPSCDIAKFRTWIRAGAINN